MGFSVQSLTSIHVVFHSPFLQSTHLSPYTLTLDPKPYTSPYLLTGLGFRVEGLGSRFGGSNVRMGLGFGTHAQVLPVVDASLPSVIGGAIGMFCCKEFRSFLDF